MAISKETGYPVFIAEDGKISNVAKKGASIKMAYNFHMFLSLGE